MLGTRHGGRGARDRLFAVLIVAFAFGIGVPAAQANVAPHADFSATPNPVVVGGTVQLDARGSGGITLWGPIGRNVGSTDPDGTIVAYAWDLDNDGSFDDATGSTTAQVFNTIGSFDVRLQVTDNNGATDIATVTILVTSQPPTADLTFSPPAPSSLDSVSFDASGSNDPDSTIADYAWDLNGDGTYETDTGTTATLTHAYATPGTRVVRVRVTDDSSATATDSVTVNVANLAPTADFTAPATSDAGDALSFDASGSGDLDGTVQHYRWDFNGDGIFDAETPSPTIVHTFAGNGTYTVRLRVVDDFDATDDVTQVVTVTGAPTASFAVLSDSAVAGSPVTFDGSDSTDTDGTVVKYDWDLDGNGSFETGTGANPTVTKTYPNPGTIAVRLRVTDDQGGQGVTTRFVTVGASSSSTPTGGTGTGAGSGGASGSTGSGAAGGSGGSKGDGDSGTAPDAVVASLVGTSIQKLRPVLKKGLAMGCKSDRAVRCELVLQIGGRKPVTIGRAVVTLKKAGAKSVKVKLSTRARRLLRRARSAQLIVRGSATDAAGHTIALRRMFLLRR